MIISERGIELIKWYEGYKSHAYKCPAGIWTIGYGHTENVREGQTVTRSVAEEYLREDLKTAEEAVNKISVALKQNQFDALVSFIFNAGTGNFKKSTLLKTILKNPDDPYIRDCFLMWVKGNGTVLQGLVRRRREEANLYFGVSS